VGAAYAISGKDGHVLYKIVNPGGQGAPFGNFGKGVSDPGDVTGDGVDDLVIGAPSNTVGGNAHQGSAYLFDGKTGALVRTFNSPSPDAQTNEFFGSMQGARGAPGDVDGDGVPDILIADTANISGACAVSGGEVNACRQPDPAWLLGLRVRPGPRRRARVRDAGSFASPARQGHRCAARCARP